MNYELWILKTTKDGVSKSINDELVVSFGPSYKDFAIGFTNYFIENYVVPNGFSECQFLLESVVYDENGNAENVDTLIDATITD